MKIINISKDFSFNPAGRNIQDGPNSGERFRNEFLIPSLNSNEKTIIDLDGTNGYGSNWLHEVFYGLNLFYTCDVMDILTLNTRDESILYEILEYINVPAKEFYDSINVEEEDDTLNTFIMIYLGSIEDQDNAGILFCTSVNSTADKKEIVKDFVSALVHSIYDYCKTRIRDNNDIFDGGYILEFFRNRITKGVTEDIGYYCRELNDYNWDLAYFDKFVENMHNTKHIYSISGFEALLDPENYFNSHISYKSKETIKLDFLEYQKWYKELLDSFTGAADDYII